MPDTKSGTCTYSPADSMQLSAYGLCRGVMSLARIRIERSVKHGSGMFPTSIARLAKRPTGGGGGVVVVQDGPAVRVVMDRIGLGSGVGQVVSGAAHSIPFPGSQPPNRSKQLRVAFFTSK